MIGASVVESKTNFRNRYKAFRQKVLSATPFIKRRRHNKLVAQMERRIQYERDANEALGSTFLIPASLASAAQCTARLPIRRTATAELCLFVTHAREARLKPHVIDHIGALLDADIAVLLIVNTDLDHTMIDVPAAFAARLYGCCIRQNVGFDFAAWAHAYCLVEPGSIGSRLYLINDSIVGPLDRTVYTSLLQRIRSSSADLVGLTSNPDPQEHLQSYYLVFNGRLLRASIFDNFMRGVVNLPRKQNVVDSYEIWLTRFFERQGFTSAAIFPSLSTAQSTTRNDTLGNWQKLIEIGFPFIKSLIIGDERFAADVEKLLPNRYR